jgi:hypothetical protein
MKRAMLIACLSLVSSASAVADNPPAAASATATSKAPVAGACQVQANRILGPRTQNRPLPLLAGDAEHGFHPACVVAWTSLSPNNQSLAVVGCYQNNLLQLENDAACGQGTGRLWVSSRWVLTSAELQHTQSRTAATCQRLDNSAVAATRDFLPDCVPQKSESVPRDLSVPAAPATNTAPAAPTSSPH